MKYGNEIFVQVPRCLWLEENKKLSFHAKWLFTTLNELEHRYTNIDTDYFFRSNELLAEDTGMSLSTVKRAKKELVELKFIQIWQMHWIDKKTGKKSEKKVTAYRLLK